MVLRGLPCCCAHRFESRGIVQQSNRALSHAFDIADREEGAADAVLDEFGNAAHACCDGGNAAGHRLQRGQTEGFEFAGHQQEIGQRQQLEKMIGVRYGEGQGLYSNTDFSALVDQANGSGTVWAVLNPAYTRLAMQQLVPETSQFPAAAQLASKLKAMTISVKGGSGIDAKFEAVCGSAEDANTFAAAQASRSGQGIDALGLLSEIDAVGAAEPLSTRQ